MVEKAQEWQQELLKNDKTELYTTFNNTRYDFKFIKTKYFNDDDDNINTILLLEYERYKKWNKLIKNMEEYIYKDTNIRSFKKGRSLRHGIGNVMSMWVSINLMKEYILIDPLIPYKNKNIVALETLKNGLCNDMLDDKYKKDDIKKKLEDKFNEFKLNERCDKIVEELIQYRESIDSGEIDIDDFIDNFQYINEKDGYFYFKYGKEEIKIICNLKLKRRMDRKYDKNYKGEKESEYLIDRDKHIACVILRYQALMGDSHQFAMKHDFKKALKKKHNVNVELFASSINSYYDIYCSLFYDIEQFFGSKGSFYHLKLNKGFYIANPPYETNLLKEMVEKFKNDIEKPNDNKLIISYGLPNWNDDTMGVFEALKISDNMVKENDKLFFKRTMKSGQVKWINELNGKEKTIASHCRFLIQNENRKIITEKEFNYLIDNFWIGDNDEFDLAIENNVKTLVSSNKLKEWMSKKKQKKHAVFNYKSKVSDIGYKTKIYVIDKENNSHLSFIVLGKMKGLPKDDRKYFFIYLVKLNEDGKYFVDKENACIGYIYIKNEEYENYKIKINDTISTLDLKKYNTKPIYYDDVDSKYLLTHGIYKKYNNFNTEVNKKPLNEILQLPDGIIVNDINLSIKSGNVNADPDADADIDADPSELSPEKAIHEDEDKSDMDDYTNNIQKYFKDKKFENPIDSQKKWKVGDCFFSSIAYAIYHQYKSQNKEKKKKLLLTIKNLYKYINNSNRKSYDIKAIRNFAFKCIEDKVDLQENFSMKKQMQDIYEENRIRFNNITNLWKMKNYEAIKNIYIDIMGFDKEITTDYISIRDNIKNILKKIKKKLTIDKLFLDAIPMDQYDERNMLQEGGTWADLTIIGEMIKKFHDNQHFPENTGLNIIILNGKELEKEKKDITNAFNCFKGINNLLNLNVLLYFNGVNHYQLIKYDNKSILTKEELNNIHIFKEKYNEYCTEIVGKGFKPKSPKKEKNKPKSPKKKKRGRPKGSKNKKKKMEILIKKK